MENVEEALKLLNDRNETKLMKMGQTLGNTLGAVHTSLSESDLRTTSYSAQAADSDLCGGSYASLTDSNLYTHAPSGICAMAST